MLVRLNCDVWMKAGIEKEDGFDCVSAVITRGGLSDWSIVHLPPLENCERKRVISIRVRYKAGTVECSYCHHRDGNFATYRIGYLGKPDAGEDGFLVGVSPAAPLRSFDSPRLVVSFERFTLCKIQEPKA